jgi:glycine dehydrogenase subunit 2
MTMNRQGRQTTPGERGAVEHFTFTGNRALLLEEPLSFEFGRMERTGVDLDEPEDFTPRLGKLQRSRAPNLPGLTEPETTRHYMRLSQKNYAIDSGVYPLGSCTMKHNPRLNERVARLSGFGDIHPLQPVSTVQGALEVIDIEHGLEDGDQWRRGHSTRLRGEVGGGQCEQPVQGLIRTG